MRSAIKPLLWFVFTFLLKTVAFEQNVTVAGKVKYGDEVLRAATVSLGNLSKLTDYNGEFSFSLKPGKYHRIALPTLEGLLFVRVSDIIYCESDGPYTRFFLKQPNNIITSKNLKEYEDLLSGYNFFRIHKFSCGYAIWCLFLKSQ